MCQELLSVDDIVSRRRCRSLEVASPHRHRRTTEDRLMRTQLHNITHLPISPADLDFLLVGLDGLTSGRLPTDEDIADADYWDEDNDDAMGDTKPRT